MKRKVLSVVLALVASTAYASTWNSFKTAYNIDNALNYFDADSIEKNGSEVKVWIQSVKTRKANPDGTWVDISRVTFFCGKRKAQQTSSTSYNKEGKVVNRYTTATSIQDLMPDTIYEGMYLVVCTPDFPHNTSGKLYSPISGNDPKDYTKGLIEWKDANKINPQ